MLKAAVVPMTLEDIDAVVALEEASFPTPWPADLYRRELTSNHLSHYLVVQPDGTDAGLPSVLAYGGFWLIDDEAHIVTIATDPAWRRYGLGEWLLLALLAQARTIGAREATLEVRPSNRPARSLYRKLGFIQVGRRKGYYQNNGEDALLLCLENLDEPYVWFPLQRRLRALSERFSSG